MSNAREAAKRLNLLPERVKTTGPRNGSHLDSAAQKVGDIWWKCGNEVAKILYKKIDDRFEDRMRDRSQAFGHKAKMDEAKRILQENRNEVFEAVLPLFSVKMRAADNGTATLADDHAHGYLVQNLFHVLVDTYLAWADELVAPEAVEATKTLIRNVSKVQQERLEAYLLNFSFEFRPVIDKKAV